MRFKETHYTQKFDCPTLGGVAIVKISRRSFTPDETGEHFLQPTLAGCENVWDCGVVAKGSRYGTASFDWPKCAAYQMMNSSGKA